MSPRAHLVAGWVFVALLVLQSYFAVLEIYDAPLVAAHLVAVVLGAATIYVHKIWSVILLPLCAGFSVLGAAAVDFDDYGLAPIAIIGLVVIAIWPVREPQNSSGLPDISEA